MLIHARNLQSSLHMVNRELNDEDAQKHEALNAWRDVGEAEVRAAAISCADRQKERGNDHYKNKMFAKAA